MADDFSSFQASLVSPAVKAVAISPDNDNDLAKISRAVYIGGAGDLAVILEGDTAVVTFVGMLVGVIYSIRAKRIRSTNTTATNIVALS